MDDEDDFQEADKETLLRKGDKVIYRVPITGHPITINEIHAAQLGLVGLFIGIAYNAGLEAPAIALAVALVGYAVIGEPAFHSLPHDAPEYETIGMKTIRHEPWWFLVPFVVSFVIGVAFIPAPAL